MIEMKVHGLSLGPEMQNATVWLRALRDNWMVPIVVDGTDVASIAAELSNSRPSRPLTCDLIGEVLTLFGAEIQEVYIVNLKGGFFLSEIALDSTRKPQVRLEASPGASIVLALKYHAVIYVSKDVLRQAGHAIREERPSGRLYLEPLHPWQQIAASEEELETAIDGLVRKASPKDSDKPPHMTDDLKEVVEILVKRMEEAIEHERYEDARCLHKEIERMERKRKDNQG